MAVADHGLDADLLDQESPGTTLTFHTGGAVAALRRAVDMPWRELLVAFDSWEHFYGLAVPAEYAPLVATLPYWKLEALMRAFRVHSGLCKTSAEDRRLVGVVFAYGKAIERDLADRQIDLGEQWRARRWRTLLNCIDGLPRCSAYMEAIADDESVAEHWARRDTQDAGKPTRRMSEFTVEVELLSVVADRLAELAQVVAATAGAKPKKITPLPRPVTAFDRARTRQRATKHRDLANRLLPRTPPQDATSS